MARIKSRINFPLSNLEEAKRILEPIGQAPDNRPGIDIHTATVFTDQPEYSQLIETLQSRGLQYSELKELYFTDDELAGARFLEMHPAGYWGYPQPEDGFVDESYEKSGYCPVCGRGLQQVRPFLVKGPPRLGRNNILALNWVFEFITTERLRDLVTSHDLSGGEFWPLLHSRTRKPIEGFHQLHIEHVMPTMSSATEFEEVTVPKSKTCAHSLLNLRFHQMRYYREDLKKAKDFNRTYEWLGGGWFGQTQWKVVSARVYQLFKKHGIKRVSFQPVIMQD